MTGLLKPSSLWLLWAVLIVIVADSSWDQLSYLGERRRKRRYICRLHRPDVLRCRPVPTSMQRKRYNPQRRVIRNPREKPNMAKRISWSIRDHSFRTFRHLPISHVLFLQLVLRVSTKCSQWSVFHNAD